MLFPINLQRSIFQRLTTDKDADIFFKVFIDRMREAQVEIRNTVTVNTTDTENRGHRDEEKKKKGKFLNIDFFPYFQLSTFMFFAITSFSKQNRKNRLTNLINIALIRYSHYLDCLFENYHFLSPLSQVLNSY